MSKEKYSKAVDKLMDEFIPRDASISDDEHNKNISNIFETVEINKDLLIGLFKKGVEAGVSVDEQLNRIRVILSNSKNIK